MRSNTTAIIGLVVGLVGAVLLGLVVAGATGDSPSDQPQVAVFVAVDDIPTNLLADDLSSAQFETRQIPESFVPSTAVADVTTLEGQRTLRPIGVGEILTTTQFGAVGPNAGGLVVDTGYEAMTIEASLAPGVEGYVAPDDKVNVYATITQADPVTGQTQTFTQLVLGHLRVLAVTRGAQGQSVAPAEGAPTQVVLLLEVRNEDVPVMVYAQQQGSLWYSIVNEDDPAPSVVRIVIDDLDPAAREASIAEAVRLQDEREAQRDAAAAAAEAAQAAEAQSAADGGEPEGTTATEGAQ